MLAFWYVDLEDRDGSSYWTGVAISLSHSIGLYRHPSYAQMSRCPFTPRQLCIWRRIWWCCYMRDAWLALGFGRPMRIHGDDCDQPLPTVEDYLEDVKLIPASLRTLYLPPDQEILAGYWIDLIEISIRVEGILSACYKPRKSLPDPGQIEDELNRLTRMRDVVTVDAEPVLPVILLHACHLQIYQECVATRSLSARADHLIIVPQSLPCADHTSLTTLFRHSAIRCSCSHYRGCDQLLQTSHSS